MSETDRNKNRYNYNVRVNVRGRNRISINAVHSTFPTENSRITQNSSFRK